MGFRIRSGGIKVVSPPPMDRQYIHQSKPHAFFVYQITYCNGIPEIPVYFQPNRTEIPQQNDTQFNFAFNACAKYEIYIFYRIICISILSPLPFCLSVCLSMNCPLSVPLQPKPSVEAHSVPNLTNESFWTENHSPLDGGRSWPHILEESLCLPKTINIIEHIQWMRTGCVCSLCSRIGKNLYILVLCQKFQSLFVVVNTQIYCRFIVHLTNLSL